MRPADLRALALERDRGCRWPECPVRDPGRLELAHLEHRGMGGSDEANTPGNTVMLCSGAGTADHHGILDGRTVAGRRREVRVLLTAWLRRG